jgi:hypothetical protein
VRISPCTYLLCLEITLLLVIDAYTAGDQSIIQTIKQSNNQTIKHCYLFWYAFLWRRFSAQSLIDRPPCTNIPLLLLARPLEGRRLYAIFIGI